MADYLSRPSTAPPGVEREDAVEECVYEVTDTGDSSMKVVVRVRPESEAELRSSCQCVVKVLDEHVLVFDPAGNKADSEVKKPGFAAFTSPSKFLCLGRCWSCGDLLSLNSQHAPSNPVLVAAIELCQPLS